MDHLTTAHHRVLPTTENKTTTSRGYSTPPTSSLLSSSSPRSVAAKVALPTTGHAPTTIMTPQQTTAAAPPPPPPPAGTAAVEAQNPFDQLFSTEDVAAAAAASSASASSPTSPHPHPLLSGSGGGKAAAQPHPLLSGSGNAAAPHPLLSGSGNAAAPHPLLSGSGNTAAPHPLLSGSGNGSGSSGSVERKNPFDDFGLSPMSSPPPRHRGPRGGRPGHRATKSLGLPSEFYGANAAGAMPPPLPGGARGQVWGAASSSGSASPVPTPSSSANSSAAMNAEAAAALKDLAASLSTVKPRALTEEEKAEEAKMLARMSLGEEPKESTGTKKTHRSRGHRRGNSLNFHVKGVFKDSMNLVRDPVGSIRDMKHKGGGSGGHRRGPSGSLDARAMAGIMDEINDSGGGTKVKESKSGGMLSSLVAPLTPKTPKKKKDKASLSPRASSKIATPLQSPVPKSGTSTPGSVASNKNDGLGGDVDSPVERNKLSPIYSSTFGGLGNDSGLNGGLSAVDFSAAAAPPPPLGVPDLSSASSPVPSKNGAAAISSLSPLVSKPGPAPKLPLAPSAPAFASACSYEATSSVIPAMRSSETDPAPHQTEIVPADVFLVHAKTCAVMDSYRMVDQNFDFGTLVGRSRMGLEGFVDRPVVMGSAHGGSSHSGSGNDDEDEENANDADPLRVSDVSGSGVLVEAAHRPIVSSVLSTADDMVVEGFFHELGGAGETREKDNSDHGPGDKKKKKAEDDTGVGRDKAADDRVEASVFYTNRRRQFVVTWRGTTADQAKPVRNRHVKAWKDKWENRTKGKGAFNLMSPDGEDCTVFPHYLDTYLDSGLEDRVFRLLDDLTSRQHFCDVVMTGHSFGAALAVLAAVRYASTRPMMRVMCHVFGCPKVGDGPFRNWANSLPNLRVLRVEYGGDPWVHSPEGGPWTHVGHTLAVDAGAVASAAKGSSGDSKTDRTSSSRGSLHGSGTSANGSGKALPVRAYKFDKHRPGGDSDGGAAGWLDWAAGGGHHHGGGKEKAKDHDLRAYVGALDTISTLGLYWPSEYVGEDVGTGVKGSGKEKRLVV